MWEESSLGERGPRLATEGEDPVLGRRFNDRFDWCVVERLGVAGNEGSALSSLLGGRLKSPVEG